MQENALIAADWALTIFFYGLAWFIAIGSIMVTWPVWEWLKRKANEHKLKGQEIIVAQVMTEQKSTIEFLEAAAKEKKALLDKLTEEENQKLSSIKKLDDESRAIRERNAIDVQGIDYESLTTIDLKAKAKELGIVGISRMNKNQLIESIKETIIESLPKEVENEHFNDANETVHDDATATS